MPARPIRSVARQTLHYMARPHGAVPTAPIGGPASWRAAEHADPARWTETLDRAELDAILRELAPLRGHPLSVTAPLAGLAPRAEGWRRTLE